jgi:membrane protein DedA with SNARE-associated domain
MHLARFLVWNAAGAICWASLVGLVSYYLGNAAANAIGRYGLYAAGGVLLLAGLGYLIVRRIDRRVVEKE